MPGSKLAWCSLQDYEDLRLRFKAVSLKDKCGRDEMISAFNEYCKTFLDIWMPNEVDQWNAFIGFPNPFFRVILEIFRSKYETISIIVISSCSEFPKGPKFFKLLFFR